MLATQRQEAGPPRPSGERRRRWSRVLLVAAALAGVAYAYWKLAIPTHRVDVRSELVALGDLDGDGRWTERDLAGLDAFLADPFAAPVELAWKLDLNRNGLLDPDDLRILRALVAARGDPYAAEEAARATREAFPRPRELYRYVATAEYRSRPRWALPYPLDGDSVLDGLVRLAGFRAVNPSRVAMCGSSEQPTRCMRLRAGRGPA